MGVKLSDLLTETTPASVQVGDSTVGLRVRVFPEQISDEALEELKQQSLRGVYLEMLPRFVASWELTDDDQPIPVTAEAIEAAGIPTPLLSLVHDAVIAARTAGKAPADVSPAGSPPAAV